MGNSLSEDLHDVVQSTAWSLEVSGPNAIGRIFYTLTHTRGQVLHLFSDLRDPHQLRRRVSYMPYDTDVYEVMSHLEINP